MAVEHLVWFVTGGSGFLGRRFLEVVARRQPSATLRVLVHRTPVPAPSPTAQLVSGSLDNEAELLTSLRNVDAVVHFAGATHAGRGETYFRINGEGTQCLVRAAHRAGVKRFVHISSRAVRPECGEYAASKLQAESAVQAGGIPYVILRFSEIYGPGSPEGLNALIRLVRAALVVPYPAGAITLAPLWLDDAVTAVYRAVNTPEVANRVYTIAGPRAYRFPEVIRAVADAFSLKRLRVPVPIKLLAGLIRISAMVGKPLARSDQITRMLCQKDDDIESARRDFGFSPLPFEEGLRALQIGDLGREFVREVS